MVGVSFCDWWTMNQHLEDFWIVSPTTGTAVSLGPRPLKIFREILHSLKVYHDSLIPYGHLLDGVRIVGDTAVLSRLDIRPLRSLSEILEAIKTDFVQFQQLFSWAETEAKNVQPVQDAPASEKFYELYRMLPHCSNSGLEGLTRFAFFMRNNPLFMNETDKIFFSKKALDAYEVNCQNFTSYVDLSELQDWHLNVNDQRLKAIWEYRIRRTDPLPANYQEYKTPVGSLRFFRNCLAHVGDPRWGNYYDEAEIVAIIENDLPSVIPTWFLALVWTDNWMDFMIRPPSTFK